MNLLWNTCCLRWLKTSRNSSIYSVSVCMEEIFVESSWNVMAHGDAREGKWRGNWRMEWVVGTLHTTSEHGVSSITTADAHNSAASSRLNWRHHRFKWNRPFRRKTKFGFCACAITFHKQSTNEIPLRVKFVLSANTKTKLRGLSPRANYTDRAAAAGRQS